MCIYGCDDARTKLLSPFFKRSMDRPVELGIAQSQKVGLLALMPPCGSVVAVLLWGEESE